VREVVTKRAAYDALRGIGLSVRKTRALLSDWYQVVGQFNYAIYARRQLNKGISPRAVERELKKFGASNAEARRAVYEASRD
jgi:hypothetical protein